MARREAQACVSDTQTRAFYDAEAAAYAASSRPSPYLRDFIAELPQGAAVLDLGCGAGFDSAALRAASFSVTSLDASSGLAEQAKCLNAIDVRVLDFQDLDHVAAFDGVWANASLHHVQRSSLPVIFNAMRRALKPGGVLHISLKAGAHDRRDKFNRFFCAMDERALRELATDWVEVRVERNEGAGYDNEPTSWLRLSARTPR
jgi:SAM-dependent methyltransferase